VRKGTSLSIIRQSGLPRSLFESAPVEQKLDLSVFPIRESRQDLFDFENGGLSLFSSSIGGTLA
jgi:hypothetical protein